MKSLPINIIQRDGESISYLYDTSALLEPLELITKTICTEAVQVRPRKGKHVELRVSKHLRNSTAQYEDYSTNIELYTSTGNIRLVPIKIRITK